ncbi:MAG: hypothetical protein PHI41_04090 [Erysipelotrichaceae bacterium]|nr:hypothetical protein [Erysipelotrichaceae bacterium]MDD3809057.1 hypothetical protein [Erysipelotrichaceae bacterium]
MQSCVLKLLGNNGFYNELIRCDSPQKIRDKFFSQGIVISDDEAKEVARYLVERIQELIIARSR